MTSLDQIKKLKQYFDEGLIPTLAIHEVHPDLPKDDRIRRMYFTLPVSINFQRSSPAMWQSALKTYEDPETNYLFYPEMVVQTPFEKVQGDLIKHKLGLQKNKHTQIWTKLSETFATKYNNDPLNFLKKYDYNAGEAVKGLQTVDKKDFPFLSGLKLSNYWMFILRKYTSVPFTHLENISIIPDTHIIQSTVHLQMIGADKADQKSVEEVWKEMLKDSEITPVEMHSVLWNWSRNNFLPAV